MSRTRVMGVVAGGAVAIGFGVMETTAGRRMSRRITRSLIRKARYQSGRLEGFRYRLAGRRPDPLVDGPALADRVRSELGPLEHRLDVPRVHVQAQGHKVLLHGDVATEAQAAQIVEATRAIPGVDDVQSHLHVGMFAGDSRPSEGARHPAASRALLSTLAAAHGAGVPEGGERPAVEAVLSTFASVLPFGERQHVLGHLPEDLRALVQPPRPRWLAHRRVRRMSEFAKAALPLYEPSVRETVVTSVLGALRDLVPEEVGDVSAVLPGELRDLWKTAIPL